MVEIIEQGQIPSSAPSSSPALYDWYEKVLSDEIKHKIPSVSVQTEASLRTGETLSMRIAFWNLNLNHIDDLKIEPWEILEISNYSEIYDDTWDETYPEFK